MCFLIIMLCMVWVGYAVIAVVVSWRARAVLWVGGFNYVGIVSP